MSDKPYISGEFVWTAIDYLGESGIGRWYYDGDVPGEHWTRPLFPWHAAYCGDIDLIGQRKPISHYRSILYKTAIEREQTDARISSAEREQARPKVNKDGEQLYMAVREPDGYKGEVKTTMWGTWPTFECWNWAGHEGKPIEVEVCSRYPRVRLYLNDKLIEEKGVTAYQAVFTLPYQPGILRAEGIAGGQVKESVTLQTAGKAKTIRLTADHTKLKADGQDLAFITVEMLDANGVVNPTADNLLTASVKGPATIVAFGNADIKDCDPYTDSTHKAWKGRALLVVRSTAKRGKVTVTVQDKTARTVINISCR